MVHITDYPCFHEKGYYAPNGRAMARAPGMEESTLAVDLDLNESGDSHARRLFLQDRRPELYADWLGRR